MIKTLDNNQMQDIVGGANWWAIGFGVALIVSFFTGIIDGITRPLNCHS